MKLSTLIKLSEKPLSEVLTALGIDQVTRGTVSLDRTMSTRYLSVYGFVRVVIVTHLERPLESQS